MVGDPLEVLLDIGCIGDQHVVVTEAVCDEVIDDTTLVIGVVIVLRLTVLELGDVVGADILEELLSLGTTDK